MSNPHLLMRRWRKREKLSQLTACARIGIAINTLRGAESDERDKWPRSVTVRKKIHAVVGVRMSAWDAS